MPIKDKQKQKEYSRRYYLKNKKKIDSYKKEYLSKNKESNKKYFREYYNNNKKSWSKRADDYYKNNKKDCILRSKNYHNLHQDRRKMSSRKSTASKYGITIEQYDTLFAEQSGKCAICGTNQKELKKSLCIDHDHKTGKVRGLLCDNCNHGLGKFKENIAILHTAIQYLSKN